MKAWVIAATSMKRFVRDRTALFFTLVLPVAIILVVGSATSRFDDATIPLGVAREGTGPLATELYRTLAREDAVELASYDDRDDVAKAVRRGAVSAGIAIPKDYDDTLRAGRRTQVPFFVDQSRGFPAATRAVISQAVASQGAFVQAATFASQRTNRSFDDSLQAAKTSSELIEPSRVGVQTAVVGKADASDFLAPGFNYQTPSNLVLFVFITSLAGAAVIVQNRRIGMTRRMYGTPTTAGQILAGETLSRFLLAGSQAVFLFAVGTVLFGVEWGDPLGAFVLILLFVAVGASVGMLFGSVLRTPEQASAIGPPVGIALGMLGGCMWPLEIVPEPMRAAGHAFPHAWAMDAWIELIGRDGTIGDITTELAVLAGFVVVLFPLAVWRLRRAIVG